MSANGFPGLQPGVPALVLAPMEGVTDAAMRAALTERGGFSYCVSEFIRVTQHPLPAKVLRSYVPEAKLGCRTPAGTPVQVQLLGGDAEQLAQSARNAVMGGAQAIDLNFGCPAPTVNRHDGGATLLKYPERIREIVRAVREALPPVIPVSAKLRLGWDDMSSIFLNARMAEEGGASWIAIHARTKVQGYVPPAHWKYIGEVRKQLSIPVMANGEIWTMEDFDRCREETGAIHYMIGRGALADPMLPRKIARELGIPLVESGPWSTITPEGEFLAPEGKRAWLRALRRFCEISGPDSQGERYTAARMKQWLRFSYSKHRTPWFTLIKKAETPEQIFSIIEDADLQAELVSEGAQPAGVAALGA